MWIAIIPLVFILMSQINCSDASDKVYYNSFPKFSIEHTSNVKQDSSTLNQMSDAMSIHLNNYVSANSHKIENMRNFDSVYVRILNLVSVEQQIGGRRYLLRNKRHMESTTIYITNVTYTGGISFTEDEVVPAPTLKALLSDAFIGQEKLQYLSLLSSTNDPFLASINNIKLHIHDGEVKSNDDKKANDNFKILIIVISVSSVTIFSVMAVLCYLYFKGRIKHESNIKNNDEGNANTQELKEDKNVNNQDELKLAPTRSLSFEDNAVSDENNVNYIADADFGSISTIHQKTEGGKTTKASSMNTIDIVTNVDMMAWKNKKRSTIKEECDESAFGSISEILPRPEGFEQSTFMKSTVGSIDFTTDSRAMQAWRQKNSIGIDGVRDKPFNVGDISEITKQSTIVRAASGVEFSTSNQKNNPKVATKKESKTRNSKTLSKKPNNYLSKHTLSQLDANNRYGEFSI